MAARCTWIFLVVVAKVVLFFPLSPAQVTTDSTVNVTTQITNLPGTNADGLTTPQAVITTESGRVTTAVQQQQTEPAAPVDTTVAPPGPGEGATVIPANTGLVDFCVTQGVLYYAWST